MILILKEGATRKEIKAIEKVLYKRKSDGGFNAKKYNGVLKSMGNPLTIQSKLRDQWETAQDS